MATIGHSGSALIVPMPGHRNPLGILGLTDQIHDAVSKAKSNMHHGTNTLAKDKNFDIPYVDLRIQFIGASGIPKMDVIGSADPYFFAELDDRIHFVSTVKSDTLTPVWNEIWNVKNVPATATLYVRVMDKDNDLPTDGYIGKFETTIQPGEKEVTIEEPVLNRSRGLFFMKIDSVRIEERAKREEAKKPENEQDTEVAVSRALEDAASYPYLFDGPVRYSRHFSPTVGHLTSINDTRLYSTWKMYLKNVPKVFGDRVQTWNHNYKAAQSIFQGPTSILMRSGIQTFHRMLYARTTHNGFGVIDGPADVHALLKGMVRHESGDAVMVPHRVKPAVYTYIISVQDDSFRFSETGAAFFVDFASKHALHSNCAEAVRYSGEFHPRPEGGWEGFTEETPDEGVNWELVIDNNSGTYSPDKAALPLVKQLLEENFPGFRILALDHEDPELKRSVDACRAYALHIRGHREEELHTHQAKEYAQKGGEMGG